MYCCATPGAVNCPVVMSVAVYASGALNVLLNCVPWYVSGALNVLPNCVPWYASGALNVLLNAVGL